MQRVACGRGPCLRPSEHALSVHILLSWSAVGRPYFHGVDLQNGSGGASGYMRRSAANIHESREELQARNGHPLVPLCIALPAALSIMQETVCGRRSSHEQPNSSAYDISVGFHITAMGARQATSRWHMHSADMAASCELAAILQRSGLTPGTLTLTSVCGPGTGGVVTTTLTPPCPAGLTCTLVLTWPGGGCWRAGRAAADRPEIRPYQRPNGSSSHTCLLRGICHRVRCNAPQASCRAGFPWKIFGHTRD